MNKRFIRRAIGWKISSVISIVLMQAIYWIIPGVREWMRNNKTYGIIFVSCFTVIFIVCFVISVINETKYNW